MHGEHNVKQNVKLIFKKRSAGIYVDTGMNIVVWEAQLNICQLIAKDSVRGSSFNMDVSTEAVVTALPQFCTSL